MNLAELKTLRFLTADNSEGFSQQVQLMSLLTGIVCVYKLEISPYCSIELHCCLKILKPHN